MTEYERPSDKQPREPFKEFSALETWRDFTVTKGTNVGAFLDLLQTFPHVKGHESTAAALLLSNDLRVQKEAFDSFVADGLVDERLFSLLTGPLQERMSWIGSYVPLMEPHIDHSSIYHALSEAIAGTDPSRRRDALTTLLRERAPRGMIVGAAFFACEDSRSMLGDTARRILGLSDLSPLSIPFLLAGLHHAYEPVRRFTEAGRSAMRSEPLELFGAAFDELSGSYPVDRFREYFRVSRQSFLGEAFVHWLEIGAPLPSSEDLKVYQAGYLLSDMFQCNWQLSDAVEHLSTLVSHCRDRDFVKSLITSAEIFPIEKTGFTAILEATRIGRSEWIDHFARTMARDDSSSLQTRISLYGLKTLGAEDRAPPGKLVQLLLDDQEFGYVPPKVSRVYRTASKFDPYERLEKLYKVGKRNPDTIFETPLARSVFSAAASRSDAFLGALIHRVQLLKQGTSGAHEETRLAGCYLLGRTLARVNHERISTATVRLGLNELADIACEPESASMRAAAEALLRRDSPVVPDSEKGWLYRRLLHAQAEWVEEFALERLGTQPDAIRAAAGDLMEKVDRFLRSGEFPKRAVQCINLLIGIAGVEPTVLPFFLERLRSHANFSVKVTRCLIEAVGSIGSQPEISISAIRSVAPVTPQHRKFLASQLRALGNFGRRAESHVREIFRDAEIANEPPVNEYLWSPALRAIGRTCLGFNEGTDAVIDLMVRGSETLQLEAAETLMRLAKDSRDTYLYKHLTNHVADENVQVRRSVLAALGSMDLHAMGNHKLLSQLSLRFDDADPIVRSLAIEAVTCLRPETGVPISKVRRLLTDEDEGVIASTISGIEEIHLNSPSIRKALKAVAARHPALELDAYAALQRMQER